MSDTVPYEARTAAALILVEINAPATTVARACALIDNIVNAHRRSVDLAVSALRRAWLAYFLAGIGVTEATVALVLSLGGVGK